MMKTIGVVSLVYLPGTFVSVIVTLFRFSFPVTLHSILFPTPESNVYLGHFRNKLLRLSKRRGGIMGDGQEFLVVLGRDASADARDRCGLGAVALSVDVEEGILEGEE